MRIFLILFLTARSLSAALLFNGTSGKCFYANPNGDPPFVSGTRISISAWIYPSGTNYIPIVFGNNKPDGGSSPNYEFALNDAGTNCFTFHYRTDGNPNFNQNVWSSSPNAVTASNVWVHVGMTFQWNSSATPVFYVDGVAITSGSWTTGTGSGVTPIAAAYFGIGTDLGSVFFNGAVGEVTMWYDTVLTPLEMQIVARSHMKRGSMQIQPHRVGAYWSMNQAPNFIAASGTNSVLNAGRDGFKDTSNLVPANITPLGSLIGCAEQICSYPPNE